MTILVTGSLGKTSSRLAATLKSGGHSFLVASRSGKAGSYPAVRFDWTDKSTWDLPFNSPEAQKDPITAAYLVSPPVKEPFQYEQAFIDFARTKGVKRFVFLGASPMDENNPYANVHRYLKRLGTEEGLEWAVLRPTWFMQNTAEEQFWHPVKDENRVISATGDGKIPFVAAEDIAAVAARALTDEKSHNTDHVILGPELMTYGDVANVLSEVLGRKITHTNVSQQELADWLTKRGVPDYTSNMLAELDTGIKNGMEDRLNDVVQKVTGKAPVTYKEYAEKHKDAWI